MFEECRRTPFDVTVAILSEGELPYDVDYRVDRFTDLVATLIIDELFPLLRELSDNADEDEPLRDYPIIVSIVSGGWRPCAVVFVKVASDLTDEEVIERLAERFGLRLRDIALRTLDPPRVKNLPAPGATSPKQTVAYMRSDFWYGATA